MTQQKTKLTIIIGLLLFSFSSSAQSPWLNNNKPGFFAIEFSKPNFNGGNNGIGFFSGVYDLSAGFAAGSRNEVIVDLPISYYSSSNDFIDSETAIGNVYLGLRTGDRSKPVRGEFGVSLPTATDDKLWASAVGSLGLMNREQKFTPDTWGLSAKMTAEKQINDNGLYYRLRGGLIYWKAREADVSLLHLDTQAQIGIRASNGIGLLASINGRTGIGDDSKYGDDDSSSFLFALGASYKAKNFEPGLTLNVPLDDPYKQAINNIINFSLLFHFAD